MKERRLPILPTLVAAYQDWWRLLSALRAVVISAFLILLTITVVAGFVPRRLWIPELSGTALGLVENAVWTLLLAQIVVAVHRFVVLGKITPAYTFPVGEPTFRLFVGWLFALKVVTGLPYIVLGVLQAFNVSLLVTTVLSVLALIAVAVVMLRLTILFPAIAVETPGATAGHAFDDTRGQALRILAVFFLALAPWFIAIAGIIVLLGPGVSVTGSLPATISLVAGAVAQTGVLTLSAAVASHAFMFLAAHLKRAAV